jgi:hypothetical protein
MWLVVFVAIGFTGSDPPGAVNAVLVWLVLGGLFALGCGLFGIQRSVRIRRALKKQPWVMRRAHYRIVREARGFMNPALVLDAEAISPEMVFSVSATARRYELLRPDSTGSLLFVTGGRRWGVVAPLNRSMVAMVKRPIFRWRRNALRRIALQRA